MSLDESKELPVRKIWRDVNDYCRTNWRSLAQALLVLLIIQVALEIYPHYLRSSGQGHQLGIFVVSLASVLISTLVAVSVHRSLLLGESPVSKYGNFKWSRIETKYVLYLIAFVSACVLGYLVSMLLLNELKLPRPIISFLTFFFMGFLIYSFIRLSVILPAIAIGDRLSIQSAWDMTAGHVWNLILLLLAIPFAYVLLSVIVEVTLGRYFLNAMSLRIIHEIGSVLIGVYFAMCLSFAYRHLSQHVIYANSFETDRDKNTQ